MVPSSPQGPTTRLEQLAHQEGDGGLAIGAGDAGHDQVLVGPPFALAGQAGRQPPGAGGHHPGRGFEIEQGGPNLRQTLGVHHDSRHARGKGVRQVGVAVGDGHEERPRTRIARVGHHPLHGHVLVSRELQLRPGSAEAIQGHCQVLTIFTLRPSVGSGSPGSGSWLST